MVTPSQTPHQTPSSSQSSTLVTLDVAEPLTRLLRELPALFGPKSAAAVRVLLHGLDDGAEQRAARLLQLLAMPEEQYEEHVVADEAEKKRKRKQKIDEKKRAAKAEKLAAAAEYKKAKAEHEAALKRARSTESSSTATPPRDASGTLKRAESRFCVYEIIPEHNVFADVSSPPRKRRSLYRRNTAKTDIEEDL